MTTKPFNIPKSLILDAWKIVKSNAGSAGIDDETIRMYQVDLKNNLYKLWNRMSSGSYFPTSVKVVPIPKKSGGERVLGIPTVTDRIAQTVVKLIFEPEVEPYFYENSYGYRPGKSALDAIGVTRKRCWQWDWVLEYDIKGLFDNINHELLMKSVQMHTQEKWILLYIERWLKTPMQSNGKQIERTCGTPQGGVISPVLANLFLHYVHDVWLSKHKPNNPWCRYADDGLIHCRTKVEAVQMLEYLNKRFTECKLALHPEKTKIIYCRDGSRKGKYKTIKFDFLGYTFQPRSVYSVKNNSMFISFTPAVSKSSMKAMKAKIRKMNIRNRSELSLKQIADICNPILRGWFNYYGCYKVSALYELWRHFNKTLLAWAMNKYKKLRKHKTKAGEFLLGISKREPRLFVHWSKGIIGAFA